MNSNETGYSKKIQHSIWGVGDLLNQLSIVIIVATFVLRFWFSIRFDLQIIPRVVTIILLLILLRLGFNWTLSSLPINQRNQNLVVKGPYAFVRHPMYAIYLYTLPPILILLTLDLIFVFTWVVYYIVGFFIIKKEERALIEIFGDKYIEYKKTVPALIFYQGRADLKLD